ncbi:response to light intensity [Ranunculus cassubicifolius]
MTFVSTRSCTSPVTYIASLPRPTLSPLLNLHIPTLTYHLHSSLPLKPISSNTLINSLKTSSHQKYTYPDPIPEFANAETRKFKGELLRKLSMSKEIGGDVDNVVNVCTEVTFLSFASDIVSNLIYLPVYDINTCSKPLPHLLPRRDCVSIINNFKFKRLEM